MSFGKRRRGGPKWEKADYGPRLIMRREGGSEGPILVRRIRTPGCGEVYATTGSCRCVSEVEHVGRGRKRIKLVTMVCTCPSAIALDDPATGRRIGTAVRTKPVRSAGGGADGIERAHEKARRAAMHALDNALNEVRRKCGVGTRKQREQYAPLTWGPSFPWSKGQRTLWMRSGV